MTLPRLEIRARPKGLTEYFLRASFGVDGHTGNVRKYLGTKRPTTAEMMLLRAKHLCWFEETIVQRKAVLASRKFEPGLLDRAQLLELEALKFAQVVVHRYLNTGELKVLKWEFDIDYIHGSTSIEGNTLTRPEVHDLLSEGTLPGGKEAREIFEITNFTKVRHYLDGYSGGLDLPLVLRLHGLLLDNLDHENAGIIRRIDVSIGKRFQGTPPPVIVQELGLLIQWYQDQARGQKLTHWKDASEPPMTHPFVLAALFHHRFETIHPFIDGNGRTGRELFNFILTKHGYPPMVFAAMARNTYLTALAQGDDDDLGGMVRDLYELYLEQIPSIIKDPVARKDIFDI